MPPAVAGQQAAVRQQRRRADRVVVVGRRVPVVADHQNGRRGAPVERPAVGVLVLNRPRLAGALRVAPAPRAAEVRRPLVRLRGQLRPQGGVLRVQPVGADHARAGLEVVVVREVPPGPLPVPGEPLFQRLLGRAAALVRRVRVGQHQQVLDHEDQELIPVRVVQRAQRGADEVRVPEVVHPGLRPRTPAARPAAGTRSTRSRRRTGRRTGTALRRPRRSA